ncbi:MAG: M1 family metallopeptidase [Planctomycetota bacterium]|jgi:hypothetical protein
MNRAFTLALLIASWSPSLLAQTLSRTEAQARGGGWLMTQLDLDIKLVPALGKLEAKGQMILELAIESSEGPGLFLNFKEPDMEFLSLDGPAGSVAETGIRIRERKEGRVALLALAEPAEKGDRVEVSFAWHSVQNSGACMVDADIALARWVGGWYPIPLPAPGEDASVALAGAPGLTTFRMPSGWMAVSNGSRVMSEEGENGAEETWELEQPYARSFAAGPFIEGSQEVDGRDFAVYLLSERSDGAEVQARSLAAAIGAMEERFGEFPYPNYAIVEVPNNKVFWYAASQQGFIMAESGAFEFGANLPLFAHEAAHAWFGNLVNSTGTGGILCDESLAQYGAVVAIETIEGYEAMTEFLRFSRRGYSSAQCAKGYFQMASQGNDKPLAQLGSGGWQHDLSDAKGHWFYHMLRRRVGDEIFFGTMQKLIIDFTGKAISLNDVRAAFIKVAPEGTRMEEFLAQWLDRMGAPVLEADFEPAGEGKVKLRITQEHRGKPYHLRVDLRLVHADGSESDHLVEIEDWETELVVQVEAEVEDLSIDPEHRLFIWKEEYGNEPERRD